MFYKRTNSPDGLKPDCKPCSDNYRKKWAKTNKHKDKFWNARRLYGISKEQFNSLSEECRICKSTQNLHIDHDHSTGKFRDVLCHHCNTGLGMFKESIELMLKAIEYIKTHKKHE